MACAYRFHFIPVNLNVLYCTVIVLHINKQYRRLLSFDIKWLVTQLSRKNEIKIQQTETRTITERTRKGQKKRYTAMIALPCGNRNFLRCLYS
jgi:hypothetical protein